MDKLEAFPVDVWIKRVLKEVYINKKNKISDTKISELEIPTGNPLLIKFSGNEKVLDAYYLDLDRAKDLLVF